MPVIYYKSALNLRDKTKIMEEGYIKFQPVWAQRPAFPANDFADLLHWRQRCYAAGWIGAYPDGIGFGNISQRIAGSDQFYISGSATGNFAVLTPAHVARVTAVAAANNELWCTGPIIASSESMSHAVLYEQLPGVGGVIHAHHLGLWESLLHRVPTTAATAPYGSPEMVASIVDLLQTTDLAARKIFVMEGHREGIFTFGQDLAEAFAVLAAYFAETLTTFQVTHL